MTDKEFYSTKRRVLALLKEWAMGKNARIRPLKEWILTIRLSRNPFDTEGGSEAAAQVSTEWMYKQAEIEFNIPNLVNTQGLELELIVIHELCHILVNEMREYGDYNKSGENPQGRRHEERVVSDMAVAFLNTKYYDQGRKKNKVGE